MKSLKAGLIDMQKSQDAKRDFILLRNLNQLSPQQFNDFYERMKALLDEFNNTTTTNPEDKVYGLTLAFYPSTHEAPKKTQSKREEDE